MKCPRCEQDLDEGRKCACCGLDVPSSPWVVIATVNPPEDALLESLIMSFGIPVKLIKSFGSVFGLSVGPLAEVKVAVPDAWADQTRKLLQAELSEQEP